MTQLLLQTSSVIESSMDNALFLATFY